MADFFVNGNSFRHALPPAKAQAVAQETLAIWCSLASRLGLWPLKAELEDLCFAVLQVCSCFSHLCRYCFLSEGNFFSNSMNV